jgi:hypothetical protein
MPRIDIGELIMMQILLLGLFPAAMAFAAASDLLTMTISNRLSLALVFGFFLAAFLIGMPYVEMGWHVIAALTVLAAAFACFSLGGSAAAMRSSRRRPRSGSAFPTSPIICCLARFSAACSRLSFLGCAAGRCRRCSRASRGLRGCMK